MAVVINSNTGLAENLPDSASQSALTQGTHEVPLIDPNGEFGSAPITEAPNLLSQGYRQPNPDELNQSLTRAKFSSTGQQIATAAEGAGNVATLGALPALERMAGVSSADIRARAATNPGLHALGEAAGMLALPEDIAGALPEMLAPGIARTALKTAIETSVLGGTDEVAKAFMNDPEQSMQSAIANMGLAGLAGGVLGGLGGGAGALWKATKGAETEGILGALKGKMLGEAGSNALADEAAKVGVTLTPEVKAAVSGQAAATDLAQVLQEGGSGSSNKFRQAIDSTKQQASDTILGALGHSPETFESVRNLSDYEGGKQIKDSLTQDLKPTIEDINASYRPIQERLSKVDLPVGTHNAIAESIGQLAIKEGYNLSESGAANKEIQRILKDIPNLKTLEDLRKYQGVARENSFAANVPGLSRKVAGALREAEESAISGALGKDAPELLAAHQEARSAYKGLMERLDDLNDRLHVGKYHGPDSFMKALGEMAPEDVARRLKGANDAGIYAQLSTLPNTANALREHQLNQLLKTAGNSAGASQYANGLNTRTLFSQLDRMSPETQAFLLRDNAPKLATIRNLLESLPARINPSGTGRALDSLWKQFPGGIGAAIGLLSGHGAIGYVTGHLGRLLGREAPDAAKLAILKFLGSEGAADASAVKGLFHVADNAYKAAKKLDKAVKGVFEGGTVEGIEGNVPDNTAKRVKLDKMLRAAANDPSIFSSPESIAPHAPEHATAATATLVRASTYLAALRPSTEKTSLLGANRTPSAAEEAKYQRALSLVGQPLSLLNHIKDNTLTSEDIKAVSTVYPNLFDHIQAKLLEGMTNYTAKGHTVPYRTAMMLSAMAGQPLIASIRPQDMQLNAQVGMGQPQNPADAPRGIQTHKNGHLDKLAEGNATPAQSREKDRLG